MPVVRAGESFLLPVPEEIKNEEVGSFVINRPQLSYGPPCSGRPARRMATPISGRLRLFVVPIAACGCPVILALWQ